MYSFGRKRERKGGCNWGYRYVEEEGRSEKVLVLLLKLEENF